MIPRAPAGAVAIDRRKDVRAWLIAVLLATGWHAVWWVWLQGIGVHARSRMPSLPEVRFLSYSIEDSTQLRGWRESLAIGSPTLFSLPSRDGFSRTVLTNRIGVRPPLAMPVSDAHFLSREQRPGEKTELLDAAFDMEAAVAGVLTAFPLRMQKEPVFAIPTLTGTVVRVELAGGLAGGELPEAVLPDLPPALQERTWEVGAFVETDAYGRLVRVFLEQRSPSEAYNVELAGKMRSWRVEGLSLPASGRISIRGFVPMSIPVAQEGGVP